MMNAKDTLRETLNLSHFVLKSYVADLSDADLIKRPGAGCNHVAWQLGHLIASECSLLNAIRPASAPELPPGFAERHSKEKRIVAVTTPRSFCPSAVPRFD
jgi:hypothetical protein